MVNKGVKLLKPGGVIVDCGMTVSPRINWTMSAVLSNAELKRTTMGSRQEFEDMVKFVGQKGIQPVVSRAVSWLGNLKEIDSIFEDIEAGRQMGKPVIEIDDESNPKIWIRIFGLFVCFCLAAYTHSTITFLFSFG